MNKCWTGGGGTNIQIKATGVAWSIENMTRGTSASTRDEEEFGMHRQRIFNLNTPYNFSG
jgi:hypothetical protein